MMKSIHTYKRPDQQVFSCLRAKCPAKLHLGLQPIATSEVTLQNHCDVS
ncbi:hypothetical protein SP21_9 [Salmonella phage 21]|nr:hypothetical protein SP21_9 [Salmonella phage 21]